MRATRSLCTGILLGMTLLTATTTLAQTYPFLDTPTQVVANYITAIEDMDLAHYTEALDPDFRFYFHESDIVGFDLPFDHWDLETELQVSANIFSGETCAQSGVPYGSIEFQIFEPLGVWEPSDHPDFPGAMRRLFAVEMTCIRPGGTTLSISSTVELYVMASAALPGQRDVQQYTVIGHIDRSDTPKPVEMATWGAMKLVCRETIVPARAESWGAVKSLYR